jgi:hypothetical protein
MLVIKNELDITFIQIVLSKRLDPDPVKRCRSDRIRIQNPDKFKISGPPPHKYINNVWHDQASSGHTKFADLCF